MTKQEAARLITMILDCCKGKEEKYEGQEKIPIEKFFEALDMAIEALQQESQDYINRQVAIKAMVKRHKELQNRLSYDLANGIGEAIEVVKALPSAEPKTAHWIHRDYYRESSNCYDVHMYVCSNCLHGYSYDSETGWSAEDYRYCPNCGARMESDAE